MSFADLLLPEHLIVHDMAFLLLGFRGAQTVYCLNNANHLLNLYESANCIKVVYLHLYVCIRRNEGKRIFWHVCPTKTQISLRIQAACSASSLSARINFPASILYKSTAGRYRPVSYPDGPITARCRFMQNTYWNLHPCLSKIRPVEILMLQLLHYCIFTIHILRHWRLSLLLPQFQQIYLTASSVDTDRTPSAWFLKPIVRVNTVSFQSEL